MDRNAIIDLTRDDTTNSDMINVVNSIVGCSSEISKYLLVKSNWDVNKTAEDFYSFGYVSVDDPEEIEKITAVLYIDTLNFFFKFNVSKWQADVPFPRPDTC